MKVLTSKGVILVLHQLNLHPTPHLIHPGVSLNLLAVARACVSLLLDSRDMLQSRDVVKLGDVKRMLVDIYIYIEESSRPVACCSDPLEPLASHWLPRSVRTKGKTASTALRRCEILPDGGRS